jgi:hypothetical protein
MILARLIDTLMRLAIEHAGAERGLPVRPRSEALQMDAEATTRGEDVIVQLRDHAHTPGELPDALVRYALRTQETMLLDDASSSQNPFSGDPYIVQRCAVPFFVSHSSLSILRNHHLPRFPTLRLVFHTCSSG